jgi:hypothetical protein
MGNILKSQKPESEQLKIMRAELDSLKKENQQLIQKIDILAKAESKISSKLSKEKIQELVSKLIKDDDINIDYLPDFVEKKIYENVLNILVNLLDSVVDTASINILNHTIKLDLVPRDS